MYRYTPIGQSLLDEVQAHQLFQNASDHYLATAGNNLGNVDLVEDVPANVRVVWCLWMFLAEVGGNGVIDYLQSSATFKSVDDLQEIHDALRAVGALEMLDLYETGIRLAVDENCGEFLEKPGAKEWARKFQRKVELGPDGLNQRSWELVNPGASELVARFIRAHRSDF